MRSQGLQRVARSGDVVARIVACAALAHAVGFSSLARAAGADPAQPPAAPAPATPAPAQAQAGSAVKTGASLRTWKNSVGMEFVHIEPGEFTMGTTPEQVERLLKVFPDSKREEFSAEQPAHTVRISKGFELSRNKVTVGHFHAFVTATNYQTDADREGTGGARTRAWFPQTDDHPAINVSWNDAHAFCDWLSKKEENVRYRLPSEAEWEYACRAGTTSLFTNGDDPEKLALIGNVADASARRKYPDWTWTIKADDGQVYTSPVGSYAPNNWGLYDMIGNTWEWCEDGYDVDAYRKQPTPAVDPADAGSSPFRTVRGSCWFIHPRRCRPADRGGFAPGFRCSFLGFRVIAVKPG